jgi:hypothetical protein
MRTLNSFFTGAAMLLGVASFGCVDTSDPFDSLTGLTSLTNASMGDGDGDTGETGNMSAGDGDGTPGDGDGTPGDGDGTPGDGDGAACSDFGEPCTMDSDCCDASLACGMDGTCGLPDPTGGDGDGAPGACESSWDPAMCTDGAIPIGVQGIEGGFCACTCASDADCPVADPGTQSGCVLSDGMGGMFCALICDPANDACPAGSTCKDLMDPNNPGLGLCTFP